MHESQIIKESLREEFELFDVYLNQALKNDNRRVADIIEHSFKKDGKRIRPSLVFLVAKACGNITKSTYHGAVTVELLHTATLIHDDVVDESFTRRGQPSANAVFDNKRSVLAGDYVLSSALRESVKTNNLEVIAIISLLGQKLAEGELNQYSLVDEVIVDEEEYFKVIELKTASLLEACARIGAITSGANSEKVEIFGKIGNILGIVFQICDDIFDYFNNDIGKPTGNDIREGKITLPLIYALKNAPEADSENMMQIINARDFSTENIEKLIAFAKKHGGIEYAQKTNEKLMNQAEQLLNQLSVEEEYRQIFSSLMIYLKNRSF